MVNLTSEGMFFTLTSEGWGLGGWGVESIHLFKLVKTTEKINFWDFLCMAKYRQISRTKVNEYLGIDILISRWSVRYSTFSYRKKVTSRRAKKSLEMDRVVKSKHFLPSSLKTGHCYVMHGLSLCEDKIASL